MLRISLGTTALLVVFYGIAKLLVTQPTLGGPAPVFSGNASPERLRRDVTFLTTEVLPRDADHPENLELAAEYIEREFRAAGLRTESQVYEARGSTYRNVIAFVGPVDGPTLVVGAHYDAFGHHPGADDNASGTAGLLELARLFAEKPPRLRTELVAFTLEEPPAFNSQDMGSAVHAASLVASGREVHGMVSLEMIGYYSEDQGSPSAILDLLYSDKGDFVVIVGRWEESDFIRALKKGMSGATDTPVHSVRWWRMSGLDSSDHRNYWESGYPAVMLTDTAYIRNTNYHASRDTADTLDYLVMASVVEAFASAACHLGP